MLSAYLGQMGVRNIVLEKESDITLINEELRSTRIEFVF